MTATTHSSTNWLIFRIGRVACAVPALSVASILPVPDHITALPGADAGNPGLFHHGSGTVAIIDLRHRFGCDSPDPRRGRLLLGRIGSSHYGFWVDSIVGLADGAQVKPAPLPPELPHNVFSAALRHQDELVLCSDLPPLLAMRDAGGLRHLVCAAPTETAAPPPPAATATARTPPPPPTTPAPPFTTATPPSGDVTRPAPAPRPESTASHRAAPVPPARPTPPAAPRRPAATPPRPTPARPHPTPAAATSVAAPRVTAPRPPREAVAYTAPPAPVEQATTPAPDRPWPLLLVLALLAIGGGYFLWPSADKTPPQITALPPVAYVAPEPVPAPAPAPAPAEPVAVPATPLFSSEGIQVEQNGKEITIVIERAKPAPVAQPVVVDGGADSAPAADPAPAPEPAPAAEPEPPQMYVHTVVRGDTLWAIAEHYLDDPWRYKELAQLSRIKNPDLIYPGNKVRIIIR